MHSCRTSDGVGSSERCTILESTLPVKFIMCAKSDKSSVLDKIVIICCALCNLCESVISIINHQNNCKNHNINNNYNKHFL